MFRYKPFNLLYRIIVFGTLGSTAHAGEAADFIAEARMFHAAVACADGAAVPSGLHPATVEAHCRTRRRHVAELRTRYVHKAMPFFAGVRPRDLPRSVVYPFGGGDLLSALIIYPDGL